MAAQNPKSDQLPSKVYDRPWIHARGPEPAAPRRGGTDRKGKWMLFVKQIEMDLAWEKVRDAVLAGKLGAGAKIATMLENRPEKVICIYTYDSDDLADVERVLGSIRDIGFDGRIYYKEDAQTLAGNYAGAGRKVSKYVAQHGSRKAQLQEVIPPRAPTKLRSFEDDDFDAEFKRLTEQDLHKRHEASVVLRQPLMTELCPSYDPPNQWRTPDQRKFLQSSAWETLRRRIKKRDDHTCRYCAFRSDFYMTVDHVDGDPTNHDHGNLQLLCAWCNSVKHAGMSAALQGHMHLYAKGKHQQVEVIKETRRLRGLGCTDAQILKELGLTKRVEFRMDYDYLQGTVGFLFNGEKQTAIGWLTVSRPDGTFLRDDENRKRASLPSPQTRIA